MNNLWVLGGIAVVSLIAAFIYFFYKKRTYPAATDRDKLFWRMEIATEFISFVLIAYAIILPLVPSTTEIDSDTAQERKIEKLVERDKENHEFLTSLRYTNFFALYLLSLYLGLMAGCIRKLQKTRDKELLSENHATKKPLGLS